MSPARRKRDGIRATHRTAPHRTASYPPRPGTATPLTVPFRGGRAGHVAWQPAATGRRRRARPARTAAQAQVQPRAPQKSERALGLGEQGRKRRDATRRASVRFE